LPLVFREGIPANAALINLAINARSGLV